jgi:hypothetical protein
MKDTPSSYHSDAVHFYTPEATKMITSQVLRHIQETIGVQPKAIDGIVDLPEKDEAFGL